MKLDAGKLLFGKMSKQVAVFSYFSAFVTSATYLKW